MPIRDKVLLQKGYELNYMSKEELKKNNFAEAERLAKLCEECIKKAREEPQPHPSVKSASTVQNFGMTAQTGNPQGPSNPGTNVNANAAEDMNRNK